MPRIPEWTPDEVSLVRKLVREDVRPEDVKERLNSPLTPEAIRRRAARYGIKFMLRKTAHSGLTALALPPESKVRRAR